MIEYLSNSAEEEDGRGDRVFSNSAEVEDGRGREKRRSDRARRPRPISHHPGKHDVGRGRSYYSAERRNTLP